MPPEPAIPGGYLREPVPEFTEQFFKKDFFPSWSEWASQRFEQIVRQSSTTNAGITIFYVVPDGKVLFITTGFLGSDLVGAGGGSVSASLRAGNTDSSLSVLLNHLHERTTSDHVTSELSFPMPIKISAKQGVALQNSVAGTKVTGGFTGFLVDATLS